MKVGIVGTAALASTWERRIRTAPSVNQVITTNKIDQLGDVDACILIDNSKHRFDKATELVRLGHHLFLVGRTPTAYPQVEQLYRSAEESNVVLQFSMWSAFSGTSQWMMTNIKRPRFLHIQRELTINAYQDYQNPFVTLWAEDIGLCLKWINSSVHRVDANLTRLSANSAPSIHIFLRFDNGSTAMIFVNTTATRNRHKRIASGENITVECNVTEHTLRVGKFSDSGSLFFEKMAMTDTEPADLALAAFLKSVRMRRPSGYSGYDAVQLVKTIQMISEKIGQWHGS